MVDACHQTLLLLLDKDGTSRIAFLSPNAMNKFPLFLLLYHSFSFAHMKRGVILVLPCLVKSVFNLRTRVATDLNPHSFSSNLFWFHQFEVRLGPTLLLQQPVGVLVFVFVLKFAVLKFLGVKEMRNPNALHRLEVHKPIGRRNVADLVGLIVVDSLVEIVGAAEDFVGADLKGSADEDASGELHQQQSARAVGKQRGAADFLKRVEGHAVVFDPEQFPELDRLFQAIVPDHEREGSIHHLCL